jgi:hypothetical protein
MSVRRQFNVSLKSGKCGISEDESEICNSHSREIK